MGSCVSLPEQAQPCEHGATDDFVHSASRGLSFYEDACEILSEVLNLSPTTANATESVFHSSICPTKCPAPVSIPAPESCSLSVTSRVPSCCTSSVAPSWPRHSSSFPRVNGASSKLGLQDWCGVPCALFEQDAKDYSSCLDVHELVIEEHLGTGSYGTVFRGHWQNTKVAVKIMYTHNSESEAAANAVEMAVLTSVQHPNIIQAYSCLTDLIELQDTDDACSLDSTSSTGALPTSIKRFRQLLPGEQPSADRACNIMILEYCDMGTLRDAVASATFTRAGAGVATGFSPSGVAVLDELCAGDVLLDIASALKFLHGMSLVHGDIKPENILIKSNPSRPSGFIAKLGDFSLCSILDEQGRALTPSSSGQGVCGSQEGVCVSHQDTTSWTPADDVHMFGSLIWEVFTRGCGAHVPAPYASLASSCWAANPAMRPTMADITDTLEQLAMGQDQLMMAVEGHLMALA